MRKAGGRATRTRPVSVRGEQQLAGVPSVDETEEGQRDEQPFDRPHGLAEHPVRVRPLVLERPVESEDPENDDGESCEPHARIMPINRQTTSNSRRDFHFHERAASDILAAQVRSEPPKRATIVREKTGRIGQ